MKIHLCNRWAVPATAAEIGATHLISILCPGQEIERPASIAPENHLRLSFHDIKRVMHGYAAPTIDHADQIIGLVRSLPAQAVLLVHCEAGMSRSPAAIIIAMAARNADFETLREDILAFFAAHPWIDPNQRLIRAGDRALGFRHDLEELVTELRAEYAAKAPIKDPNLAL